MAKNDGPSRTARFLLFIFIGGEIHGVFPSFAIVFVLAGELVKLGKIDFQGACLTVFQNAEVGELYFIAFTRAACVDEYLTVANCQAGFLIDLDHIEGKTGVRTIDFFL